jgi:hypothetical protein
MKLEGKAEGVLVVLVDILDGWSRLGRELSIRWRYDFLRVS